MLKKILGVILYITFTACSTDEAAVNNDTEGVEETTDDTGNTEEEPKEETQDPEEETEEETTSSSPNILLIIADDMGLDASPGYDIGSLKPSMPNLEAMMSSGVIFDNMWSYPTCTPTRASILTGTYGLRTDVLKVGDVLSSSETSLQRYLSNNSNEAYSTALIGKWHLSRDLNQPTDMGIDYFAGIINGGVQDYYNWDLVENGTTATSTVYATTKLTDLAIDWVADQTQAWFLWLAYNAPHTPFHLPPTDLHSQGNLPSDQANISANPLPYYLAAIEAMDTEMGRLLSTMSQEEREHTIIIFIGDNGTPNQVRQEYANQRTKGSVYQGGVNVPMVVSGVNVSRMNQREDALIGTTDLFSTIADIAGTGTTEINDSKSFKGLLSLNQSNTRPFAYTEIGQDTGGSNYTVRNETHKFISFTNGAEALFNLSVDPLEVTNLLDAAELPLSDADALEKDKLTAELTVIRE